RRPAAHAQAPLRSRWRVRARHPAPTPGGRAMTRIARCCALRAEASGEPAIVAVCHCLECQRRTGPSFGVSTYFPKQQVGTKGPSKVCVRGSYSGRKIECCFCPECGSTVFWHVEWAPDMIGIAFGEFADPSVPGPRLSVWRVGARMNWDSSHYLGSSGHRVR